MPQDDLEDLDELWSEANPTAAQLAAERAALSRGELTEASRRTAKVSMRQAKRRLTKASQKTAEVTMRQAKRRRDDADGDVGQPTQ